MFMERIILPLGNGVGLVEDDKLCVSIINYNGDKKVGGVNLKNHKSFWSYPILRGLFFFFYGLFLYLKVFFLQEELDMKEDKDKNKSYQTSKKINFASGYILLLASLIIAFLFGLIVLGFFPKLLLNRVIAEESNYYFCSFIKASIKVVIIYLTFTILRVLPFMQSIYSFNGAGNIFLNERKNKKPIKENFYPLNFLNFLLNVFLFSSFMVSLIAVNIVWWANFLINLLIFVVCIILVYEFLFYSSSSNNKIFQYINIITNWLVCISPNITHKEVFEVAKLELESNLEFEKVDNDKIALSTVYAEMKTKLNQSERFSQSDVDWIIATILNKNRVELKLCRSVSQKEYRDIMRACERRAKGEPLSNIFGFVDFYGMRFDVNKKVLSPRMETEILVEEVLKKAKNIEAKTILDLCTGSGAIAVVLAKYSNCKISAIDISKQALQVAQNNAEKNNVDVEFLQSDLFNGLKKNKKYDIIVSNPPYIKSEDIEKLDIEVKKYDPRLALDGGIDGYDFYRQIIQESGKRLNKNGWLFFELGQGQKKVVYDLMIQYGFEDICVVKDYNKIERIIYGRISN